MEKSEYIRCPNCGAPVTTEVCSYCHSFTGLDSDKAEMDFPVIKCKEARLNKLSVAAVPSFSFLFMTVIIIFSAGINLTTILFIVVFGIIGLVWLYRLIEMVTCYLLVTFLGKVIEATVYGYIDDKIEGFNYHTKYVKLLINTKDGPKFILYQLDDTKRMYNVNDKIKLKMYKNIFLLLDNVKY